MALGKRKNEQQSAWVATTELPKSPGHPFYKKLNALLAEAGFDEWLEKLCAPYYAAKMGRDSIPPGVYFRMILVGYFEGISSQRGIAWRCSDSRSLAEFLGVPVRGRDARPFQPVAHSCPVAAGSARGDVRLRAQAGRSEQAY